MPIPNNPDVVKVAMVYARDTRQFINTLHFAQVGGWTLPNLQLLATDIVAWWEDFYRLHLSSEVSLQQVQVRLLDPSNPLAWDFAPSPSIPGSVNQPSSPSNVSLTMSWRTGLAGRKYRGRIYAPGILEGDAQPFDDASAILVATLANAASNLLAGAIEGNGRLVIFHLLSNTFTYVTSAVIESLLDSQRRRLAGRGR